MAKFSQELHDAHVQAGCDEHYRTVADHDEHVYAWHDHRMDTMLGDQSRFPTTRWDEVYAPTTVCWDDGIFVIKKMVSGREHYVNQPPPAGALAEKS